MGDDLKNKFGAEIELIAGSGGVYEVELNGNLIFSKKQTGRFPELDEIISLVKAN